MSVSAPGGPPRREPDPGNQAPFAATQMPELRERPDNRAELFALLDTLSQTQPGNFALVMADVNGLTDINDNEGHAGGDRYLERVRATLTTLTGLTRGATPATDSHQRRRRTDRDRSKRHSTPKPAEPTQAYLIHINGDEFAIVLVGVSTYDQIDGYATRMTRVLAEEHDIDISMDGLVHQQGQDVQDLYREANEAQEVMKKLGKVETYRNASDEAKLAVRALIRVSRETRRSPRTWAGIAAAVMWYEELHGEGSADVPAKA